MNDGVPLPVVFVEIAPPPPEPQLVQVLLDACSEGIREATCVLADEADEQTPWGLAIVSWRDEEETRVRIEFGRHGDASEIWQSREVEFDSADTRTERWRTVGYTVGTLADRGTRVEPSPSPDPSSLVAPQPVREANTEQEAKVRKAASSRDEWLRTGVALAGGPGLAERPWRGGFEARATAIPLAPLFATASVRHQRSPGRDHVAPRWTGLTVGLGGQITVAPVRLELDAELLAEDLHVSFAEGDLTDAGHHWSIGALGRLAVAWPRHGPVGLIGAGQGFVLREPTVISVRKAPMGRWPAAGWSLTLGGELRIR